MNKPELSLLTCRCNNCDGYLEFERERAGERVDCPHCGMETALYVPSAPVGILVPEQEPPPMSPAPPPLPPPLPQVVWYGTEASTVEIRTMAGTTITAKEIQLYDEQELKEISVEKARASELFGGSHSPFGFIGGAFWVISNLIAQNYVAQKNSEKMAKEGIALMKNLAKREQRLRNTRNFFPIGRVENTDHPAPGLWRVVATPEPYVRYAFIHSGDDFITLKDDTGIVYSVRWSAVEQYNYRLLG